MHTVVVSETIQSVCADWLAQRVNVVHANHRQTDLFHEALGGANGLVVSTYTQVNGALLARAPKLRVVGRTGVGLDNVDLDACRAAGVPVVYTPEANTHAVVEYVLALMLDELRPRVTIGPRHSAEDFHRFRRELVGTQLDTLKLGILGFGRIGRRLGRVAHALGMSLLVHDLLPQASLARLVDYPFEFVDQATLLGESDVLSVHVDGRAQNRHLVGAEALARLKPTCLFINTSRGMIVDAEALAHWASSAAEAGGRAVLDVHEPEPIPPSPPQNYCLYGLTNVRLLPHIAARTSKALQNMSWVVRDVVAVLEGREPQFPA